MPIISEPLTRHQIRAQHTRLKGATKAQKILRWHMHVCQLSGLLTLKRTGYDEATLDEIIFRLEMVLSEAKKSLSKKTRKG